MEEVVGIKWSISVSNYLSSACMREPGVQYISAKNTVEAAVNVIATPRRCNGKESTMDRMRMRMIIRMRMLGRSS